MKTAYAATLGLALVTASCDLGPSTHGSSAPDLPNSQSGAATVGHKTPALMAAPGFVGWSMNTWPVGNILVCWGSTPPNREAQLIQAIDAWENTDNSISFAFSSGCTSQDPHIEIRLVDINSARTTGFHWGSWGESGVGPGSPNTVTLAYCGSHSVGLGVGCEDGGANGADYDESFRSVAIHEIGHALGYNHEQQRIDSIASCAESQPTFDDGGLNPNNTTITDGFLLTGYDSDSIMNYCRGTQLADGGATVPLPYQSGYQYADALSPLDVLGAELTYPASTVRPLRTRATAFQSSAGAIVRSDDIVAIDWSLRGASNAFFDSVEWIVNGQSQGVVTSPRLELATYSGTSTFSAVFSDVRQRSFGTQTRNLTVDTSLHTALISVLTWP